MMYIVYRHKYLIYIFFMCRYIIVECRLRYITYVPTFLCMLGGLRRRPMNIPVKIPTKP